MIQIRIVQNDFRRIMRALNKMEARLKALEKENPYKAAVDYYQLVKKNILTGKFALTYAPYSPMYAAWKTVTMMMGSQFWKLYGDLVANLTVYPVKGGVAGGIPPGVMDSGGKSWFSRPGRLVGKPKSIAMYGAVMEFGLHNHPARPVFEPTMMEYFQSGFQHRGKEALQMVGGTWR